MPKTPSGSGGAPGRRNPVGRRHSPVRLARPPKVTAAETARLDELRDDMEFRLARICSETSHPDLTWREWHAQRALCSLATGKARDDVCPERCREGCRYLAVLRAGYLADDPTPWWRDWRDAEDRLQPAISAAKRSNR